MLFSAPGALTDKGARIFAITLDKAEVVRRWE